MHMRICYVLEEELQRKCAKVWLTARILLHKMIKQHIKFHSCIPFLHAVCQRHGCPTARDRQKSVRAGWKYYKILSNFPTGNPVYLQVFTIKLLFSLSWSSHARWPFFPHLPSHS